MAYLLTLLEVVSVVVLVMMWRRPVELWRRLLWTPVLLLPMLGPALYFGMFELPQKLPSGDRAAPSANAVPGYRE
jgi:hypothetical protein